MDYPDNRQRRMLHHSKWTSFTPPWWTGVTLSLTDPRALHDLAQHDGPRFPGQPLGSGFDAQGLVERGYE